MTRLSPKLSGTPAELFHFELSETSGYVQNWHTHDCHMLLLPRRAGCCCGFHGFLSVLPAPGVDRQFDSRQFPKASGYPED